MTDQKMPSKGNLRIYWAPDGAFANHYWPTVAELNAGQELHHGMPWDGWDGLVQASETEESTPIGSKATRFSRGAANYGGDLSFWYPGYKGDMANAAALIYEALGARQNTLNVGGYLYWSVDGEIGEAGQPSSDMQFASGDYVNIIKVTTDAWDDEITGENDFSYTRTFLKNGFIQLFTVASTAAPVLAVSATGTTSIGVGDHAFLNATVNGREWTRGVSWTSDDLTEATVSRNGIVTGVSAGTPTITATLPGISPAVTDTIGVTVS